VRRRIRRQRPRQRQYRREDLSETPFFFSFLLRRTTDLWLWAGEGVEKEEKISSSVEKMAWEHNSLEKSWMAKEEKPAESEGK